jgi:hypothetical protein
MSAQAQKSRGCDTAEILVDSFLKMPIKRKPLAERSLTPLCIRFRAKDLEAIRFAAARSAEAVTVWVREIILMHVTRVESGMESPPLKFEMDGLGKPFSIRFRPADYKRVARCAAREDRSSTAWARAIVVEYASRPRVTKEQRLAAVGE